jgi:hypothetical protein
MDKEKSRERNKAVEQKKRGITNEKCHYPKEL